MSKKLWFKAKRYGWGWYPSSWEGWVVTFAFVAVHTAVVILFIRVVEYAELNLDQNLVTLALGALFVWLIIFIGGLFLICYTKGEKPGWRWGNKK